MLTITAVILLPTIHNMSNSYSTEFLGLSSRRPLVSGRYIESVAVIALAPFFITLLQWPSLRGTPCPSRFASSSAFMCDVLPRTRGVHSGANDLFSTCPDSSLHYPRAG